MTSQDFTIALFCRVDDALRQERKHPLSALYPSEVVTIGMLQVLRGEGNRAFYRWLCICGTAFERKLSSRELRSGEA